MELNFHVVDYVIMGAFLLISLTIGIYYGVIQKQRTTEEYLFGNRQISMVPVAISMLVTYQSAISVVGIPAEIYIYNTMVLYLFIGIAFANLLQYWLIVPLMYPLRLTSPYESGVKIGSMQKIWNLAVKGGRIDLENVSIDPTVRHTVWSLLIGMAFNWLPNCCNQSAVQRICAMKNLKQSKIAVLLNIPLLIIYGIILCLTGVVMYAYFANEGCDPFAEGIIPNGNQVTPYFVMHLLSHLPGLAGLFIAALFSGSLSSLSSGINAMAANTIEDVLVNYFKTTSQWKQTLAAKIIVIVYGLCAVVVAYAAKDLTGPVTQIALCFMGAVGGPVCGMIFLGGIFPQANWIGAIGGGIIGLCINVWVSVCSVLYGNKAPKSPSIGIEGCMGNHSIVTATNDTLMFTTDRLENATEVIPR